MENTEATNNENELTNQVEIPKDSNETPSVGDNKTNTENNNTPAVDNTSSIDNSNKENTSTNNESSSKPSEKSSDVTSSPKEPELVTRKSSRNLSKEERLKRQRELRKKRILESSHERLSRITKTYSQGSSFYDSEKDDSSLSRKSSSRSIHHHSIERSSSRNSINSINSQVLDAENSHVTNEPETTNIRDLSRGNSINSINSINKNNETVNKDSENTNNTVNENVEVNSKEPEITENTSINTSVNTSVNNSTEFNPRDNNIDNNNNSNNNNRDESNDFARVLFREMLKEEFNKNNDSNLGNNPTFGNINNMNDLKNNMDSLLTSDKPFEALGKMFDFLSGGDEKTTEEQRIAEEKYKQYCKLSSIIHTVVTILYSLIVVFISFKTVNVDDIEITGNRSGLSSMNLFFYKLANMDTLSYGKSILGMTPWTCLVLLEFTLLAGQIGYQYAFNIKKETWKEFDLIPIPIINKAISLINQYKLYIEVLVNDLFLYLFIIGFSVSIGKLFY